MSLCAIAFALPGPAAAEVEPKLLSAWQGTVTNATGTWILHFRPEFDGRYRTRITGPAPVPDETGMIEAVDGRWSVVKDDGSTDAGTYVFATDDVVTFTGKHGTVVWQRESSLPAAVPSAPMIPSPGLPGAGPPSPPTPGMPAAPSAPPESGWPPANLPAQAASLLDRARQWQADAVLEGIETDLLSGSSAVVANLQTPSGRATLKFIYCSPATRRRLVISPGMAFGETWEGESPRCETARTPPADFLDLPQAVERARARGLVPGDPQSASLRYVTGVEGEEESGWMWQIHPPRYSHDQVYEIPLAASTAGTMRQADVSGPLAGIRGRWRASAGGAGLELRVDGQDAFSLSVVDPATGASDVLGRGSVRRQDRRSRVIFDPSPSLVTAAERRKLRGFYGSMVVEDRRLSPDRMAMQGHDLVLIEWAREGEAPAAGPGSPAIPLPGPGVPAAAPPPLPVPGAQAGSASGDAAAGTEAPSQAPAGGGADSGLDRKIEKAGSTVQSWADKAGRKIGGFLDRLGGSGGD